MSHQTRVLFEDGDYKIEINNVNVLKATLGNKSKQMTLDPHTQIVGLLKHHVSAFKKAGKAPSQIRFISQSDNFFLRLEAVEAVETEVARIKSEHVAAESKRKNELEELIPGLEKLKDVLNQEDRHHNEFNRMVADESNDGVRPPTAPTGNSDELKKQFPKAAVYVKAENYGYASNHHKSAAGRKAKRLLESGGTVAEANEILNNWLPETSIWD